MTTQEIFEKYNTNRNFTFDEFVKPQYAGGHNKWITKYPKTGIVIEKLKMAFGAGDIDYNFITDHFGGRVSEFSTGIKQQDVNKLGKVESMKWEEFLDLYSDFDEDSLTKDEWEYYRKPQLINYVTAKDLRAKKLPLDLDVGSITTFEGHSNWHMITLRDFLKTKASFRTISKTQYNIFTPATEKFNGGIFSREGNLKVNDPEEVGEFVCQISIDEMNYKKDFDMIAKLWEWRTKRNEKRSVLEEHFGFDTKHCSHLFRLLIGAKNILETGEYKPRLTGDNLKLVKGILNGEKTYDWIIEESEKMERELETSYNKSTLPKTPNHKKANELLLELSRKM